MKISVISDSSGKIIAASFRTANLAQAVGPRVTDQIKTPDGHRVHQVDLPAELAEKLLSGDFARTFSHYTLEVKDKKAVLKPGRSNK